MRIRFIDSCVSDAGMFGVGQVHDLPEELATGFVKAGLARSVPAVVEEATAPAAPEVAVSRKGKGRS